MAHESINSLILKTAHSDREAFEKLYIEMQKPVYYYALRFCGNHEIAEDVMQDTFITVWSKSATFVSGGSGRAWILTIAKNKTINEMKKIRPITSIDDVDLPDPDGNLLMDAIDAKITLGKLLGCLNKRDADIVILRHAVGLTLTQIAAEKNLKRGTVFWAYNAAIKKLREAYERMEKNET